ncbi:hypothetical protein U9M48_021034 [Paspalum notatum var. saurae]|uniref:Integrase catalytic domain-containing protein n=1 Tax=Paspalum notatum var. saurae TaxID=547442 RepID=A0AAQ3TGE0_PASNO
MASSSSSSTAAPQLGPIISEKLTRENYLLWKAQVMPTIRGAQLVGILKGTLKAPANDKTESTVPNPDMRGTTLKKTGHEAPDCWYHFEENYWPKMAGSATASYGIDTNWYADSGATNHITGELEKLTVRDRYNGHDQDRDTKKILLQGRCEGDLYPLSSQRSRYCSARQVFSVNKPSVAHCHLCHPAFPIVSDKSHESVCDPCQQAKSHQLPYSKSVSASTAPLELVYSNVWGLALMSVGRHTYYVSFIDDFSKYTWIYLLRKKSDVFHVFSNFQQLVERKFDKKILTMQTDWGGEYEKLISFFQKVGIAHRVSCPHAHQQNGSAERKHRHIVEVGLLFWPMPPCH